MKKLITFSEDEYTAMVALVKDTKKEIETIKKYYNSYALCRAHDKLIEILSILFGEGD